LGGLSASRAAERGPRVAPQDRGGGLTAPCRQNRRAAVSRAFSVPRQTRASRRAGRADAT
jgi:hypothetical protein